MKNHRTFGIKAKLSILVGIAVVLICGQGFFSYTVSRSLVESVEHLGNQRLPLSTTMSDMRSAINSAPRFMWLALAYDADNAERKKFLDKAAESMDLLAKSTELYGTFQITDEARVKLESIKEPIAKLNEELSKATVLLEAGKNDAEAKQFLLKNMPPIAVKATSVIDDLAALAVTRNKAVVLEAQSNAKQAQIITAFFSILCSLGLAAFGYIFSSQLAKRLMSITNTVGEASSQVASASTQLSNAADSLSSSSQEQASSVQETSSSLTEIAGMVESNVKVAESANHVAQEVFEISEQTQESMEHLVDAMSLILESNTRIEALVKVIEEIGERTEIIDDIVFKTQLLSFNASVEAERAGEHGRGFAVVAQEVGNLAQMSGKAASEISSIVKTSIKEAECVAKDNKSRVEKGSSLAVETKQKMIESLERIKQILEGTQKIVSASKEQSQGVNQISTSVDSLNQTVQETASTAEESASASQELSSQAESLMALVNELRLIVSGSSATTSEAANKMDSRSQTNIIPFKQKTSSNSPPLKSAPRRQPPLKATASDPWDAL
ncbi:MAG TPA: methyl-accepting chemotaxis protein [Pseudobdellovibrionaceae bacterium]